MAWAAVGVVAAAVVAALVLLGSPQEQRARRLDERREEDLRGLASAVDLHYTRAGRLPGSLGELSPDLGPAPATRDPDTGEPYEFQPTSDDRYRLCATFTRESSTERWGPRRDFWSHGAGRHCFELQAERVER
jgi:hypothetical protein